MNPRNWKYAAGPTIFVVLLALYPQLNFWIAKGSAWQGAYFASNFDEVAYSAYVNALMNGKPRKYDPYLAAEAPHESLYSIQFVPAYSIALPARLLGVSASTAFIILAVLSAAISALFIFWLLFNITANAPLSAVGVVLICCLGTAAAFEGELRSWIEGRVLVDYLPFLRRYQPGFAFPLFFLFCGSVWHSLGAATRSKAVLWSLLSGILFAALVYSYFFLWTAAAAWTACVYLLFLIWHRDKLAGLLINLGSIAVLGIAALVPYFMMLSARSEHVDSVQLLTNTHMPELSPSMTIGVIFAVGIVILVRRGVAELRSPRTLFALAFALTPVVLFNQQVITGRSLQPVHYEIFISNYLVLTALALLLSLIFGNAAGSGQLSKVPRALVYVAIVAALWGIVEVRGSMQRNTSLADLHDLSIPAARYIEKEERPAADVLSHGAVLATNTGIGDFIPTVAALRPLWSSHSSSAGGIAIAENKRLFYCWLYYTDFSERDVADGLKAHVFEITAALFGSERALPELGQNTNPVTPQEIAAEARSYGDFAKNFSKTTASDPPLSYVVASVDEMPSFYNLDKWYERDAGTVTGKLKVYAVKLRP